MRTAPIRAKLSPLHGIYAMKADALAVNLDRVPIDDTGHAHVCFGSIDGHTEQEGRDSQASQLYLNQYGHHGAS
jgi:hypothetical protein